MTEHQRMTLLRIALWVAGLVSLSLYPLMLLWPSGWAWHSGYSDYPMMLVGVYATLGVFLIRAARHPAQHASLIWFAVWSSVVHGAIMAVQSFMHEGRMGHLMGDVPALLIAAAVLAWLAPRRSAQV
ncbi:MULTISPECIES: DUF6632 domain-containing protein [Dyella]|uniref:DUF4345 domain-containing protein n=2 Tax=Dyella TaxID=231454 RepID=A0A4R0YMB9_9GAMM|nr:MULTISPECIES: DUF6632 domain-containing protein [Dyella]TBR35814.1 hypothetical protein EYV96_17630 [Dyella terrae]TCI08638.1 hypothetical protein EZM97_28925 [Dyella soli]